MMKMRTSPFTTAKRRQITVYINSLFYFNCDGILYLYTKLYNETMMDENMKMACRKTLENAALALKKNNFACSVFEDSAQAADYIVKMVGRGARVGLGGSVSIKTMGLAEKFKAAGNTIITHTPGMDGETRIKTWLAAQAADFYFASPQAVTMNGELVMLDMYGNRVAACIYGPKKVVLVAGSNKLVSDLQQGLWRMKNVSAIANNIRLRRNNPCVKTGRCEDCSSPERICNVLTVFCKKPAMTDIEVVLVNEELGY